eukprot:CAMPEP_0198150968 /NCGR_PEP_ID=MMETSP1443-20131203/53485_1 /TAXON_ID=186043 /ORGANISM="Entomoneis sp., Strain CCMP2396" /LENGTH=234 /DNA_ID=CAMNT_0043816471 /DNA_START=302 /DNA_END=1009 /DNA_ORIENTATION=-
MKLLIQALTTVFVLCRFAHAGGESSGERSGSSERRLWYGKKEYDFGYGGKKGQGLYAQGLYAPPPSPAPTVSKVPSSSPVTSVPSTPITFQCIDDTFCETGQVCFSGQCVTNGTFRFSLSWQGDVDLNLGLGLPDGSVVTSTSTDPTSPATFDTVPGDQAGSLEDAGLYVESIYFTDTPASGAYAIIADQETAATVNSVFTLTAFDDNNTAVFESFGIFFENSKDQEQVYFFYL